MNREERLGLITEIEHLNDSHVIAYITGDRDNILQAHIADDAVRPMYSHLLGLDKLEAHERKPRIDLFLYSRGGSVSVPWRVVSMLREFCKELCVLVPYKAHSAATMICLGADKVVMGRKAELGPIDPTLYRRVEGDVHSGPPSSISVEDVSSYVSFLRKQANINDQAALAQMVGLLAKDLTPLILGSVNRQHSHIRLVAKKLLLSRGQRMDEDRVNSIIEALTEKMYSHGHAIGRTEAKDLGLSVEKPPSELESLMWLLYTGYEKAMCLSQPVDPEALLGEGDTTVLSNMCLACIESVGRLDALSSDLHVRRVRQILSNPNINVNLNLAFPANIDINQIPQEAQTLLQTILQQVEHALPGMITAELNRQSQVTGIQVRTSNVRWGQDFCGQ